jgi:hypothetical protein
MGVFDYRRKPQTFQGILFPYREKDWVGPSGFA